MLFDDLVDARVCVRPLNHGSVSGSHPVLRSTQLLETTEAAVLRSNELGLHRVGD